MQRNRVLIVGGGLAGLISSLVLNRAGFSVTLIEKKAYPFHRVCGEYISNEVQPFLKSLDINIAELNPSSINKLALSSVSGRLFKSELDLGGFGLSRFTFDHYLYRKALSEGVEVVTERKVNDIVYQNDLFEITLDNGTELAADFVIAAFGKRSNLDRNRDFFYKRSPFVGVKYHIKIDLPENVVQLDNFIDGYCGTVKIEDDRYCLCYLSRRENLKKYGNIAEMERKVLWQNPFLKDVFQHAEFLYDKPEVINEVSFEQKSLVENHVFFCGDAAGMISPLCGNGMAMAIHSAKLLSEILMEHRNSNRLVIESLYTRTWNEFFKQRLQVGRLTQKLFGAKYTSEIAVACLRNIKLLSNLIMSRTHGVPF